MGTSCPTCGKELTTERGMRQHHTKVHDEPLPNRTCSGCGADFYDPKARRKYCNDCNPEAGEHNGNWKGAQEETTCKRCGTEFSYYPSNKKGIYCHSCIENGDDLTELGPKAYAERVTLRCEQCRCKMDVLKSRVARSTVRFCSSNCRDTWLSENYYGERHHSWKEGESKYRGTWWYVRRQARKRDDYTCQNCGTSKSELGQNPHVHHVKPIRNFEDPQEAHTLDNVVTLCPSCHHKIEHGDLQVPDGPWK